MRKCYFISGGTSSIGKATIEKIKLQNEKAKIFYTYFKNEKENKKILAKYNNIYSFKINLEKENSIKKLKKISEHFDAIILTAAQTKFYDIKKFKNFKPELFKKIININLINQYYIVYYLLKNLKKNSHVVFISSVASKNAIGSNAAYSASKAAINNLAIFFARALAGKVYVNSVAPGLMRTKLTKSFKESYFKKYKDKTLSKKLSTPENIADFILYLISEKNNITGQTIFIDGGC